MTNMAALNNSVTTGLATGPEASSNMTRRCEDPQCNVPDMLASVPRSKSSQLVKEPYILDRPLLKNGFQTIFQVEGTPAKLCDIKDSSKNKTNEMQTIYRIVPNTHAHIVNYVVVNTEGESFRKMNESDPVLMNRLLGSQKLSAEQMLEKLIASCSTTPITGTTQTNTRTTAPGMPILTNALVMQPQATQQQLINSQTQSPVSSTIQQKSAQMSMQTTPTSSINLPMRMHPNLKITAVSGAKDKIPQTNMPLLHPNNTPPAMQPYSTRHPSYMDPMNTTLITTIPPNTNIMGPNPNIMTGNPNIMPPNPNVMPTNPNIMSHNPNIMPPNPNIMTGNPNMMTPNLSNMPPGSTITTIMGSTSSNIPTNDNQEDKLHIARLQNELSSLSQQVKMLAALQQQPKRGKR